MPSNLKQVKVNLKPDVHAELKQLADEQGLTIAELFRTMIGTTIDKAPKPTDKREHKKTDPKVLYLLKKTSDNANQIATYANRKKVLDSAIYDSIITLQSKINEIRELVK